MKKSNTPKIVVGVGLVVAYATGLAVVALRDDPVTSVVQTEVVAPLEQAPEQVTADSFPPDAITSVATNPSINVAEQTAAVVPEPVITKARGKEPTIARQQPMASMPSGSAAVSTEVEMPTVSEVASAAAEPATPAVEAPSSAQTTSESSAAESQVAHNEADLTDVDDEEVVISN